MTKNATKRALLFSVLSLVLCMSMFVGTTYAWFTDSVTSANNKIIAGNLKVDLEMLDAETGDWNSIKDSQAPIFDYANWEPGYVDVKVLKVQNEGTLAFKWMAGLRANEELSALANVIDVYVKPGVTAYPTTREEIADWDKAGTVAQFVESIQTTTYGTLEAGKEATLGIALKMQESAGNEYQGMTLGMFDIMIIATQLTFEEDSFNDQYDAMATVDSIDELNAALAGDYDLIMLGANIELSESLVIPADKTVTIDLCGFKIHQAYTQTTAYAMIDNKGTLTVKDSVGSGKISYADTGAGGEYASNTVKNSGTLNVYGGTIENTSSDTVMAAGYPHAIDVYQGSVTNIYGGTVKSVNYDSIRMFCNSTTLATTLNISGGTIINRVSFQNPGNNTAGYGILNISGGNFVTTDNVYANVRLLNFSTDVSQMKATVTGGTFDKGFITKNYNANATVTNADWLTFTGVEPTYAVTSEADLTAALAAGGNIVLTKDTAVSAPLTVAKNVAVTLDLGGKVLSHKSTEAKASCAIDNKGDLTIKNGTLTYEGVGDASNGYGTNTITNSGNLVIEGATVINTTNVGSSNAIDNAPGSTLVVNGGVITSEKITIRVRDGADVTINDGIITGARSVQIHLFQGTAADTKLTINGGTFNADYALYSYAYGNVTFARTTVEINGGEFNGIVGFGGGNKTATETVNITGGAFNDYLGRYLANDGWEDIAKP